MNRLTPPAIAILLSIVMCPARIGADEIPNESEDYMVTSWGHKDGVPTGGVHAIAQDREGYLWLGTIAGLLRFDGISFAAWESSSGSPLPKRRINELIYTSDGSLWVGFGSAGGVSRIRNAQVRNYGEPDGLLAGPVTGLVQLTDGTIWVANIQGLFRLSGERWEQLGPADGLPRGAVYSVYVDQQGRLLAGTSGEVFRRAGPDDRFERIAGGEDRVMSITEDAGGTLVITDPIDVVQRVGNQERKERRSARGRGYVLLRDQRGTIWAGTSGQGFWRLPGRTTGSVSAGSRAEGLVEILGDWVLGLFEDRDGNIWVGTYEGLNRLSRSTMVPVRFLRTASAVDLTPDGAVWVTTADRLIRFAEVQGRWQSTKQLHVPGLRALHVDKRGAVWVATNRDLLCLVGDALVRPVPSWPQGALSLITSITSDSNGDLWLYSLGQPPYHLHDGRLESHSWQPELDAALAVAAYTDRQGRVWFTSGRGVVRVLEPGEREPRTYDVKDGLGEYDYGVIYEDRVGNIWLGGRGALSRFKDGAIQTINVTSGFPGEVIRSVIEDHQGDLWIGNGSGIVRMDPAEFELAITTPGYQIRYSLFDVSDGVYGLPVLHGSRNSVRTTDGRLWFVTARGLTIVNPAATKQVRLSPKVSIEGIVANGRRFPLGSDIALPSGTDTLEIQYSALELTSPQKIRFRYLLEHVDKKWVDGDSSHQARYTSLPPGAYRFHVTATTGESAGDPSEAVLQLRIAPVYYRTTWFFLAASIALATIVWSLWRLRLWQIHQTYSKILEERARLGRAIHDTLLQSLVGIGWQCDVIAHDVESSAPATKAKFIRMRDLIEGCIREARHSIWDLRSPSLERRELSAALADAGAHAADGTGVSFEFTVNGEPRRCSDVLEEHVLRIGQEAVFNAVRHASARVVRMELAYTSHAIHLRVSDDGQGFDPERVRQTATGHYGLECMRERAANIEGTLTVSSAPGRGTLIETIVPTPVVAVKQHARDREPAFR